MTMTYGKLHYALHAFTLAHAIKSYLSTRTHIHEFLQITITFFNYISNPSMSLILKGGNVALYKHLCPMKRRKRLKDMQTVRSRTCMHTLDSMHALYYDCIYFPRMLIAYLLARMRTFISSTCVCIHTCKHIYGTRAQARPTRHFWLA